MNGIPELHVQEEAAYEAGCSDDVFGTTCARNTHHARSARQCGPLVEATALDERRAAPARIARS